MVWTRLSHVGEVCPLRDHSYTDLFSIPHGRLVGVSSKPSNLGSATTSNASCTFSNNALQIKASTSRASSEITLSILNLPFEILEKIISYLTFKNIGEIRQVCKRFDQVGGRRLNVTFSRLLKHLHDSFHATKAKMPRRESARRKHHLARESDILETLYMRLTLLEMTIGKRIEMRHCAFYPGEILDEIYRVLRCIKHAQIMGKTSKITDELYDLTTMAMEHFKEKLEPILPELFTKPRPFIDAISLVGSGDQSPISDEPLSDVPGDEIHEREPLPPSTMVLRKRIRRIRKGMKRYNGELATTKRELKACKGKINDQSKQLIEHAARFEEYDKKLEESSRKFNTILQELNRCNTELQFWRSKSMMRPFYCWNCGTTSESGLTSDDTNSVTYSEPRPPVPLNNDHLTFNQTPYLANSSLQDCPNTPSSYASSVKNLEPLFDIEPVTPAMTPQQTDKFGSLYSQSVSAAASSSIPSSSRYCSDKFSAEAIDASEPCDLSLRKYPLHPEDEMAILPKRLYSDDDSENDVDTVGKRVRERKRMKMESH